MELDRDARAEVDVFAKTFALCSLMVVAGTYAFSDDVQVISTTYELHVVALHNISDLIPNFLCSP